MPPTDDPAAKRMLVARVLQAMLSGSLADLRTMLTDDVVWHVPPSSAGRIPPVQGVDALLDFVRSAAGLYYEAGSLRLEPVLEAAEEDRCMVLARIRARTRQGRDYENLYAFGFRLRDERVCEVWELLDTVNFRRQMGL